MDMFIQNIGRRCLAFAILHSCSLSGLFAAVMSLRWRCQQTFRQRRHFAGKLMVWIYSPLSDYWCHAIQAIAETPVAITVKKRTVSGRRWRINWA